MIQQFSVRARADARPEDRAAAREPAERPREERQRRLEDRPEQPEPVNVQLHVISFPVSFLRVSDGNILRVPGNRIIVRG